MVPFGLFVGVKPAFKIRRCVISCVTRSSLATQKPRTLSYYVYIIRNIWGTLLHFYCPLCFLTGFLQRQQWNAPPKGIKTKRVMGGGKKPTILGLWLRWLDLLDTWIILDHSWGDGNQWWSWGNSRLWNRHLSCHPLPKSLNAIVGIPAPRRHRMQNARISKKWRTGQRCLGWLFRIL